MRTFHAKKNADLVTSINVDQLWHAAGAAALAQAQDKANAGKALVLDVTQKGFHKVLGKGRMPDIPLVVKARYVSKLAEAKIRKAGGAVVLTA